MHFVPLMQRLQRIKDPIEKDISLYAVAMVLVTGRPINDMASQAQTTLASSFPDLTVVRFRTFNEQISGHFTEGRMIAHLTGRFAALALLLATIGFYDLTAYAVVRRTSEIGVRMALRAARGSVVAMVMRGAMVQVALGLVIGIPVALACVRFVKSELYEITNLGARVMAAAIAALVVPACVADFVPARRAASIDPVRALRSE